MTRQASELLDRASIGRAIGLFALSALTGCMSALLVPLVLYGMEYRATSVAYWSVAGAYTTVLFAVLWLRRQVPVRLAILVEERLATIRADMLERVRDAPLRTVETRAGAIEAAFDRDIETLANLPRMVEGIILGGVTLFGVSVYLLLLSPLAGAAWLLICFVIAVVLRPELLESEDAAEEFDQAWEQYSERLGEFTDGMEQFALDRRATRDITAEFDTCVHRLVKERYRRDVSQRNTELKTDTTVALTLATLLFWLPANIDMGPATTIALVLVLLYAENLIAGIVKQSQFIIASRVAWRSICELRARLTPESVGLDSRSGNEHPTDATEFERLTLERVEFAYVDGGFILGPLDFEVRRGEIVFITGSNGSGKTTLMKVLCGLYVPQHGAIKLNGRPVAAASLERYRSLFTVIFASPYLFARTYGLHIEQPEKLRVLLKQFALDEVTEWLEGSFTDLLLSTGQTRRLAMVVALLEDRPILVLDEWAAHQDPELRRYFYETLLPELQARGKTIVAVTHDARFFDRADRLLPLDIARLA